MRSSILALLLVLLGVFLRQHNVLTIPRHGATFDEFAWVWLGVNVIQKGNPISWSPHPQYKSRQHLIYQGAAFWIVSPYLEHPPLFGLLAGVSAILMGAKDMYTVTLANMRPLAIILGTVSLVVSFLFLRQTYGRMVALIALAIYATMPTAVVGSRIVQNENFLIPLWLTTLYVLNRHLHRPTNAKLLLVSFLSGIAVWAKIPWLVVGASIVSILWLHKKIKDGLVVVGVTACMFLLYLLYGYLLDAQLFSDLWKLQVARYDMGFDTLFSFFTQPLLVDRPFIDGVVYLGWFSMIFLLTKVRRHLLVVLPFLSYLFVFLFAIPNEPAHGWYRYPFLPFLVAALAIKLKEELVRPSFFSVFIVLFWGLSFLSHTWQNQFGFSYSIYRLFLVLVGVTLVIPLWIKRAHPYRPMIVFGWFLLLLFMSSIEVLLFSDI